eukprot:1385413-Rhodomonas_salina.1
MKTRLLEGISWTASPRSLRLACGLALQTTLGEAARECHGTATGMVKSRPRVRNGRYRRRYFGEIWVAE